MNPTVSQPSENSRTPDDTASDPDARPKPPDAGARCKRENQDHINRGWSCTIGGPCPHDR
ncbi:hypothetical protein ACFQ0T_05095 [Kitasatospora gansuensis]